MKSTDNQPTCEACGDHVDGRVCPSCGTLKRQLPSVAEQKDALQEFHDIVRRTPVESRAAVIRNGFIPETKALLLDAGLAMVVTLDSDDALEHKIDEAAASRLKAIIMKLRFIEEDATAEIRELEIELKRHEQRSKKDMFLGLSLLGGCALAILAAIAIVIGVVVFALR